MKPAVPNTKRKCLSRRWIQYATVFTATLCMMASGMHYGWSSPALPKLQAPDSPIPIPITNDQGSWIASLSLLGDLVGAPLSALGADYLGRKTTIILGGLPYFIAWIMIAFTSSLEVIYCARFLAGIGDGVAYTIIPMYIGEIAEDNIRGLLGTTICTMADLGILMIYIIGPYVNIMTSALISSLFPLALLVTFWYMPESPYYLLMRGKQEGAKTSLQKLRGREDVDNELNEMSVIVEEQMMKSGSIKEILVIPSNRNAILILIGLKAAQQFSGITAFLFYVQIIFEKSGGLLSSAMSSILFGLVQLISSVSSSLVIDRLGRKPLLIMSCIFTAIPLVVQGSYFYIQDKTSYDLEPYNWIPMATMLTFVITYSFGLGVIPYMMPGELFPTNIKAKALCIMDLYLALAAFMVAKIYQVIADAFGSYVPFFVFTVCCLLSLVFVILCVPETKGRSLEEIQMWLKGHKDYGASLRSTETDRTKNNNVAEIKV